MFLSQFDILFVRQVYHDMAPQIVEVFEGHHIRDGQRIIQMVMFLDCQACLDVKVFFRH